MQTIMPCLWFDYQAEEAVNFYVSIFRDSKILNIARYSKVGPGPEGSVMTVVFQLNGQHYMALNGGPIFKFTEAISLVVRCDSQAEIDEYWKNLSEDGEEGQCGWVKDKYGLSWQIVPSLFREIFTNTTPETSERVMRAIHQMRKLDIATLKEAAGL